MGDMNRAGAGYLLREKVGDLGLFTDAVRREASASGITR
jgi:hypothetical protein